MRLKVKDQKAYKGKPEKGDPPLEIPLRNGMYAQPGQEFGADAVLGGQQTMEGLLKEKPCRVVIAEDSTPDSKGVKADLQKAIKEKQDAEEKLSACTESLEECKMELEDANKEIENLREQIKKDGKK
jgi:hypothetical protein